MEFRIKLIDGLITYFQEHCAPLLEQVQSVTTALLDCLISLPTLQSNVKKILTVTLNYMEVKRGLVSEVERIFTQSLRNEPEQAIACVGVAMYQVGMKLASQYCVYLIAVPLRLCLERQSKLEEKKRSMFDL